MDKETKLKNMVIISTIILIIFLIIAIVLGIYNKENKSTIVSIYGSYTNDMISITDAKIEYFNDKAPILTFNISKKTNDNIEVTLNMILYNEDKEIFNKNITITTEDLKNNQKNYSLPNDIERIINGSIVFELNVTKIIESNSSNIMTG